MLKSTIEKYEQGKELYITQELSLTQIAKILKLGINKVYILRDNDEAGYKSAYSTYKKLKNFIDCKIIKYPKDFK